MRIRIKNKSNLDLVSFNEFFKGHQKFHLVQLQQMTKLNQNSLILIFKCIKRNWTLICKN